MALPNAFFYLNCGRLGDNVHPASCVYLERGDLQSYTLDALKINFQPLWVRTLVRPRSASGDNAEIDWIAAVCFAENCVQFARSVLFAEEQNGILQEPCLHPHRSEILGGYAKRKSTQVNI
jgi:hypothetical protein